MGTGGRAVLTYDDWLENAMDCWVAQLGVPTELHDAIAREPSLRMKDGRVQLAGDPVLRNREIGPFVIDMENNGLLSNTGDFRTQVSDVEALVTQHVDVARREWKLGVNDVMDVAIYAHGGLTSEGTAAETAKKWIEALYNNRIFPIFLMWETDLWNTLKDIRQDQQSGEPRTTGGIGQWWNQRLEKWLAVPGSAVWGEMKENADQISVRKTGEHQSGGIVLYDACAKAPLFSDMTKVRLHLIGHSAGAIVHSHIVDRLGRAGWNFESVNFMAPAVRVDTFEETVVPAIQSGKVKRFNQFHLVDAAEQRDHSCRPVLLYGRSLLYLVSQSFEQGKVTPILGMEKYFEEKVAPLGLPNVTVISAPGPDSGATEHGAFDDDKQTINKVLELILGKKPSKPV